MTETTISEALDPSETRAVLGLLHRAFDGGFGADDWHHAIGGRHVLVTRDGVIAAHAAVVTRRIRIGESTHRAAYVEAVATEPRWQGAGHGTTAMEVVAALIGEAWPLGVLSTGAPGFYERLGWQRWSGPSSVRRASGAVVPTPDDDGGIMVLLPDRATPIDLTAGIRCDERQGDDW